MKVEEISINSKEYPQILKEIYDPPSKLYILGNKEILQQKGIAIVGSRNATEYGKKVAFKFAKDLSQKGINIISGLALGIDSFAHLGCSQETSIGKTIAELRKATGWTQIELAEKLQVSDKAISKWEQEGGIPSVEFFPALAEVFGVSIDYLMTGKRLSLKL